IRPQRRLFYTTRPTAPPTKAMAQFRSKRICGRPIPELLDGESSSTFRNSRLAMDLDTGRGRVGTRVTRRWATATTALSTLAMTLLVVACSEKPKSGADTGTAQAKPLVGPAPDSFRVAFTTTRGDFVVQVNRAWSPQGADRFYDLVGQHFF